MRVPAELNQRTTLWIFKETGTEIESKRYFLNSEAVSTTI